MLVGIDGNEANVKNRVGSGQYAYELLHQFAQNKKHRFLIYLKDKPLLNLPKESANFKYRVFGPKKLWTQFALPIRLMLGERLGVFFSMAHYGPRFSRVPYVVTIHDLSYLHYPEMFRKSDLYQLVNWSKYSIKNSAHIIAVSQTTKKDIVTNYKVRPPKITVTYEGYDPKRFEPQPKSKVENVKSKYKIKGDYLIFVGTLQPRKNLERLIEAFSKIIPHSQFSILNLVIVGKKGWLFDSIFEKAKKFSLEEKIIFTDYVTDADLPALISGAKAYVLPSLWEGFGIPVIEAQACGVPVVVSNVSSLPEIVTSPTVIPAKAGIQNKNQILDQVENDNRASAILVDPTNVDSIAKGIQKALAPKTRSDLIQKGFENIKRFSWHKCAAETLKVLEKVASKQNP